MNYFIEVFKKIPEIKLQSWAFILAIIFASFIISKVMKKDGKYDTRKLTYGSLCIALAFILSYIRLFKAPYGGSVTLGSMLPIIIFAFIFGLKDGILAGMVYGLLQLIQDAYVVHWFQLLLDYPLAFGALGLAGYFRKNIYLGLIAGGIGRMIFHILSGVFFFASYAPEGMNPVIYSIAYNGAFIAPDIIIAMVIVSIPQFRHAIRRIKSETAYR